MMSVGDLSQSYLQRLQNTDLKERLDTLTRELSTGQSADISAHLSGDYSGLSSIDRSLERLSAFATVITETTLKAQTTQSALASIQDRSQDIIHALIVNSNAPQSEVYQNVAIEAERALADAMVTLNTRVSDRSIFAGTQTDGPAIVDSGALLAEAASVTASATTSEEVVQALSDWFDDPAGFTEFAYLGGDELPDVRTGAVSTTMGGVTAVDPALQEIIEGLVLAALPTTGAIDSGVESHKVVADAARVHLLAAESGLTALRADVGRSEEALETAGTRNAAEVSGLKMARSSLLAIDPYETVTDLEAVQGQLEMLYTVTARLQRLSLADFI